MEIALEILQELKRKDLWLAWS